MGGDLLEEQEIPLSHTLQELHNVALQVLGRIEDTPANRVDDLAHGLLLVEDLPDEETNGIHTVVLPGLEVEEDAALSLGEVTGDDLWISTDLRLEIQRYHLTASIEADRPTPPLPVHGETEAQYAGGE